VSGRPRRRKVGLIVAFTEGRRATTVWNLDEQSERHYLPNP
jgi:hypothetical protein